MMVMGLISYAAVSDGNATNTLDAPETGYDFVVKGIYYKIRYDGSVTTSAGDKPYSGDIVIPDEVTFNGVTYKVTKVAGFHESPNVTSITIPKYTRRIARFYGGINLWVNSGGGIKAPGKVAADQSVNPDEMDSKLKKVIFNAVQCDTVYRYVYETTLLGGYYGGRVTAFPETVTTVVIGDNVEKLPQGLLYNCKRLSELTIPDSIKTIGKEIIATDFDNLTSCTYNCNDLEKVEWFPKDRNIIRYGAGFSTLPAGWYNSDNCPEHIDIPANFKKIAPEAFYSGCRNLKSVTLPEGLVEIGDKAFSGTRITEVVLPKSLKLVGVGAFNLKKVTINSMFGRNDGANDYYSKLGHFEELTIGSGIDSIFRCEFSGKYYNTLNFHLKKINFEEGIKFIDEDAFANDLMEEISLPNSLRSLGRYAFRTNKLLKRITFGENIDSIGYDAFAGTKIEKLIIPDSWERITIAAFRDMEYLNEVKLGKSTKIIGNYAFENCTELKDIDLYNVEYIGVKAFNGTSIEEITIPNETIPKYCFEGNERLKTVRLGDKVKRIEDFAFVSCKNLSNVDLNKVQHIGQYSFTGTTIESLRIPASVRRIGYAAFRDLQSLKEIKFNGPLQYIGGETFNGCDIVNLNITYPVDTIGYGAFSDCAKLRKVHINAKESRNLFISCNNLEEINYGNQTYHLNEMNLPKLKKVTITSNLSSDSRYYNVPSIDEVIFTDDVTRITNTFSDTNIANLKLSKNVIFIDAVAFISSRWKYLTLPESLETIGFRAFDASEIETVEWNAINAKNLYGDSNLNLLYCPDQSKLKINNLIIGPDTKELGDIKFQYKVDDPDGNGCWYYENTPNFTNIFFNAGDFNKNGLATKWGVIKEAENIYIGNQVGRIPDNFAIYNDHITEITIPGSVTEIGNYAFANCSGLKIYMENPLPPVAGADAFKYIRKNEFVDYEPATLYVPTGASEAYRRAPVWMEFVNIIEMEGLGENGVDDIIVDEDNDIAPIYYNLQGARVDNPTAGLYIVKKGDKTSKQYIK